jgi:hypothetical protein
LASISRDDRAENIDVDRFIASLQALQVQPISADDWTVVLAAAYVKLADHAEH